MWFHRLRTAEPLPWICQVRRDCQGTSLPAAGGESAGGESAGGESVTGTGVRSRLGSGVFGGAMVVPPCFREDFMDSNH